MRATFTPDERKVTNGARQPPILTEQVHDFFHAPPVNTDARLLPGGTLAADRATWELGLTDARCTECYDPAW
jgi:hypothetical protein